MIEIERKFLVTSDAYKKQAITKTNIAQGYLSKHPERNVRIRIKGERAYITIKGASNSSGTSRFEWEKEIELEEGQSLLSLCERPIIAKYRYEVKSGNHLFEVDEFLDDNQGLVIAEVELTHEDETFVKPNWLGKEVTGDPRYYNSQLSNIPFSKWFT
ncbi:CYTH domain-containing protein [Galbibacter sp.]|uniref:CYTH domain-containing protein n=1 Tax=Galbibacter sp. TaxID=2918471 RepID=UPI002CD809B6|nr:CYTH domain-containing protein [Galbibacter sp.]HLV63739.1 CYTH domain-containing protein [Galbibacter sp.]